MLILSAMPNTQSLATVASVAAVMLSSTFSGDARTLSNREVLVLYNSANP